MEEISCIIIANESADKVLNSISHIYDSVDEIIVIYQNKKYIEALKSMAMVKDFIISQKEPEAFKIHIYYAPELGLAEVYKAYGESLCSYKNIIAFDTDERFTKFTISKFPELFKAKASIAYRIRRQDGKGHTWQYRIWVKGSLKWRGFVHEHPVILTQKQDLNNGFLLYHVRDPDNKPDYNKLLKYQWKSPFLSALMGMAIDLAVNKEFAPRRFVVNWQGQAKEWGKLSKADQKIRKRVMETGIAKVIGSDTQAGIDKLIKEYDNEKVKGTDLLMQILKDRCN